MVRCSSNSKERLARPIFRRSGFEYLSAFETDFVRGGQSSLRVSSAPRRIQRRGQVETSLGVIEIGQALSHSL